MNTSISQVRKRPVPTQESDPDSNHTIAPTAHCSSYATCSSYVLCSYAPHVLTFLCFQTPSPSTTPQPGPSFSSTCPCFFLPRVEPLSQPCSLPVPPSGLGNEAGLDATSPVRPVLKVSLNERSTCKAQRKDAGQQESCCTALLWLPPQQGVSWTARKSRMSPAPPTRLIIPQPKEAKWPQASLLPPRLPALRRKNRGLSCIFSL